MERLDADNNVLRSTSGQSSARDIVQFVEFSRFSSNPSMLAEEVLKEIPNQLVSYMLSNKILPNPLAQA